MFPSIVNRNINPYDTQNTMFLRKKKDLGKCHQLDVVPVSEHDSVNTPQLIVFVSKHLL